jgi:DNA modification methylase
VKLETLKLDQLNPADYNPRIMTAEEFEGLKESLKTFGQQENLIVNKDMTIISGHQRYEAMKALGMKEAVCNLVDLDKHQEKKLNVLMNSQAISGKYDDLILAEILEELKLDDDYESLRLNVLEPLDLSEKEVEEDEAPEVSSEPPVSKLGEIYQLGRHRVMCGDSTDKASVELLMDGVKADMVFTDPPYGVDYSGRGQNTSNKIENDNLSIEDTEIMVSSALSNAFEVSRDGTTIFVWHADSKPELRPLFERAFIGAGFKLSATIIWLKKQASMGFQDYRSRHEPCLYGWKGTRKERVTDRTQTTVWESGRDSSYEHPTQKPVFLAANAIANHNPGVLLDLFLGSGSTLIACEQTDRTCYGMELDPKYVDVIRKRYAKFIGKEEEWQSVTQSVDQP